MATIKLFLQITGAFVLVIALLALQATLDEHNEDPLVTCHVRSCT